MANYFTDYYAVLGISPTADGAAIKRAYRAKAIESHPDRHPLEEAERWHRTMQQINEAFEILSNPEKRRGHDDARRNADDHRYQHRAATDAAQAQRDAGNYPRDFKEFESWLDRLTRDFTDAEYDEKGGVNNSVSGFIFAAIGFIAGIGLCIGLAAANIFPLNAGIWAVGAIGAGMGVWVHKQIGYSLRNEQSQGDSAPNSTGFQYEAVENAIVNCPKCNGALRLPNRIVNARCPRCQNVFSHTPGSHARPAGDNTSNVPVKHDGKSAFPAVLVGFVAFVILSFVCTQESAGDFGEPNFETNWPAIIIGTAIAAGVTYYLSNPASQKN